MVRYLCFRADFRLAFDAWLAADPLHNPDTPISLTLMPEYRLADEEKAQELEEEAGKLFAAGEQANYYSSTYVL